MGAISINPNHPAKRNPITDGRQALVQRLSQDGRSFKEVADMAGVSLATALRYAKGQTTSHQLELKSLSPPNWDPKHLNQAWLATSSLTDKEKPSPRRHWIRSSNVTLAAQRTWRFPLEFIGVRPLPP